MPADPPRSGGQGSSGGAPASTPVPGAPRAPASTPNPPSSAPHPPASSPGAGPSSTRGCIKGSVVASRLAFVRDRKGEAAVRSVLSRLPEADQRMLTGTIMPFGWYAFALYLQLDSSIAQEMGIGEAVFRMLGARSAADNLGADHKRFIRERDPHGLLKQSASIYRLYYDTGERTYERASDKKAIVRTLNSLTFAASDCLTVIGWHEKAIELCGGASVKVTETQCRVRGGKVCEYVCEWE